MKVRISDRELEESMDIYELLRAKGIKTDEPYQWSRDVLARDTIIEQPVPKYSALLPPPRKK